MSGNPSNRTTRDFIGDPVYAPDVVRSMSVDETEPTIRYLYGPRGEVLSAYTNRPPIGFHQGQRTVP